MSEPRVKTEFWVQMALRRGFAEGRPGVLIRRGDNDAGGVLLVLRGRAGLSVLSQMRTASGESAWLRATGEAAVSEQAADAYLARQLSRDPDLWVVEFEAPDLLPPFEAKIV
jgi:hypothetical protein